MDTKPLTKAQRRILLACHAHGSVFVHGGEGSKGNFSVSPIDCGGAMICAYQTPEVFLAARGLIEPVERNVPGRWWRLTDDGKRRVARMKRSEDQRLLDDANAWYSDVQKDELARQTNQST